MKNRKSDSARENLLSSLQERAKELNCLYRVEEVLNRTDRPLAETFQFVARSLVAGWQYPEVCRAAIVHGTSTYVSSPFEPSPWVLEVPIEIQKKAVGAVRVYYLEERPAADVGPFLQEEVRLANTIAERLGHHLLYHSLKDKQQELQATQHDLAINEGYDWRGLVRLLRKSDTNLYLRFARRMLNNLASMGIRKAQEMLHTADAINDADEVEGASFGGEVNQPGRRRASDESLLLSDRPFHLAAAHLNDRQILTRIQAWMQEDKASALLKVLDDSRASLFEISDALRRMHHLVADTDQLPRVRQQNLSARLVQRVLNERLDFIKVAKEYLNASDFKDLLDRTILPPGSSGKLGGKAAGLVLAHRILERATTPEQPISSVKMPRTWYVVSDAMLEFIGHNDLEDVVEQKYKEIDLVRQEYPNLIQLFKNSPFPLGLTQGLSMALDDLGEVPLIVRSSSLLEDRLGTSFSGKYKSLFLANQGTKKERLNALMDAIAEIYASVFGPDPIAYRKERELLDFNEEMGILIQEVVGNRIGKYFLPAFAGVAFSHNGFRWSPRIRREDGLLRLVPGLGTRAVDRVADDYPILVTPGQPGLRVNVALDEVIRYSPKKLDVIDLDRNTFETVEMRDLLLECGADYPGLEQVFSVLEGDRLRKPVRLLLDPGKDELVVTFHGLIEDTPFLGHLHNILLLLQEKIGSPVDVEFAHDGRDFYLLQCRPQSRADEDAGAPIPRDEPKENIVFSANRFVTNGRMLDITHVVYVDPDRYGALPHRTDLIAVGRAVGRLNKVLPKRQFILMGPGRWGSRGDIKLGVSVTYADISNTAMLIEIARQKGPYRPELSFGTHFFQDLVESRIRYLPLYPDEEGIVFNERFLRGSQNLLPELLPDFADLTGTVRVIDVAASTDGRVLQVLLNADLDEALALLTAPGDRPGMVSEVVNDRPPHRNEFWRWRLRFAEQIAAELDPGRFGVEAFYVFGSTKNATAGPGSDIDILVHFRGTGEQRRDLESWLEGWSLSLAEMNYLRTGYRSKGLLDVHLVTDEDITRRTSYAVKIGAVTDAARKLELKS